MTKALDNLTAQQAAVRKAQHALDEANDKLRKVKLWTRDFDGTLEPLSKGLNPLRSYLDHELPQGIALLAEVEKIMESYTEIAKPSAPAATTITANPRGAIMSSEGEAGLAAALKNLRVAWDEARGHWRDAKALEFEERFLKDLPSRVTQAASVMADIDKVLKKARIDCD